MGEHYHCFLVLSELARRMVAPVGHALRSACIYELGHTQRCLGSGEKAPVREVRERSTVHRALAVVASLFWLGFAWFVLGSVAALMGEGGGSWD